MNKPADVQLVTETELAVKWADGHESFYPARYLRQHCRCAACVNEVTGARMLRLESVPETITLLDFQAVGHYAVRFEFSDHHATGIYSFDHLREICPCRSCST